MSVEQWSMRRPDFLCVRSVTANIATLGSALRLHETEPASMFRSAVRTLQGDDVAPSNATANATRRIFAADIVGHVERRLVQRFLGDRLQLVRSRCTDAQTAVETEIATSLQLLGDIDPEAGVLFDLLVHTMIVVDFPLFGGRDDALGVIIVGPEPACPSFDTAALLWHEAVHQTLFLEELLTPLFNDQSTSETMVRNPVLGVDRPVRQAFHGAAVACAVAMLEARHGRIRRALSGAVEAAETLRSIIARPSVLTVHGRRLADDLVETTSTIEAFCIQSDDRAMTETSWIEARRSFREVQDSWLSTRV